MMYELWDGASGNAIGGFATEAAALAVVRAEVDAGGDDAVREWFLRRQDGRGRSRLIGQGADLVNRAQADAPQPIA